MFCIALSQNCFIPYTHTHTHTHTHAHTHTHLRYAPHTYTHMHAHKHTTQLNLYSDVFITVKTGDTYNTGWHSLQYMNIKHWNYITTITLHLTGGRMSLHCYFNHSGRPHANFKQNSIEIYFNSLILCHVFNIKKKNQHSRDEKEKIVQDML